MMKWTFTNEPTSPTAAEPIRTSPKSNWQGELVVEAMKADRDGGDAGENVVIFQGRETHATVARVPSSGDEEEDGPESRPTKRSNGGVVV